MAVQDRVADPDLDRSDEDVYVLRCTNDDCDHSVVRLRSRAAAHQKNFPCPHGHGALGLSKADETDIASATTTGPGV